MFETADVSDHLPQTFEPPKAVFHFAGAPTREVINITRETIQFDFDGASFLFAPGKVEVMRAEAAKAIHDQMADRGIVVLPPDDYKLQPGDTFESEERRKQARRDAARKGALRRYHIRAADMYRWAIHAELNWRKVHRTAMPLEYDKREWWLAELHWIETELGLPLTERHVGEEVNDLSKENERLRAQLRDVSDDRSQLEGAFTKLLARVEALEGGKRGKGR